MAGAVLHIELDSFFVSVEQLRHPEHAGRPVIVGADPAISAGIVSSVNDAARKAGVRKGMPVSKAHELCPDGAFIPVDFAAYRKVSGRVHKIISSMIPRVQAVSIDEFVAELPEKKLEAAGRTAMELGQRMQTLEGIRSRIGIGPNRLFARLAAGSAKPMLPLAIGPEDLKTRIWPLKTSKLPGIGRKTSYRLAQAGISTIGELANADVNGVVGLLGEAGYELHRLANGIEDRPLPGEETKSVSRETTFSKGVDDAGTIIETVERFAEDIYRDLSSGSLSFSTVGVKLRYEDLETHTRSRTIPINNSLDLLKGHSKDLISPFLASKKKVRLVGVRVDNLSLNLAQKSLLEFAAGKASVTNPNYGSK